MRQEKRDPNAMIQEAAAQTIGFDEHANNQAEKERHKQNPNPHVQNAQAEAHKIDCDKSIGFEEGLGVDERGEARQKCDLSASRC